MRHYIDQFLLGPTPAHSVKTTLQIAKTLSLQLRVKSRNASMQLNFQGGGNREGLKMQQLSYDRAYSRP